MELIREYKLYLSLVNRARNKANNEDDKKLLASCADSLNFSIEYMDKGRAPGNRRSITRRSGTQREIPVNPENINFIRAAALQRKPVDTLSDQQKELLEDLLHILTKNEKEAFIMVRGNGYSFSEAGETIGVAKGTVQNLVYRAEEKLHFVVRKGEKIKEAVLNMPVQRIMIF